MSLDRHATYVVVGPVPGFRPGTVVEPGARRAAYRLSPQDMALLEAHEASLVPVTPPAEAPDASSPEAQSEHRAAS